ncbi:MAG: MBOAT family O-acyltransferase [Eubacteriales bacterium]|nr:MBOAT family O-acyltransferase [Eubacteriales bacterium]
MLFSSITFLYVFLPVTMLLYWAAPVRARNVVLLLASLVFYFFGEKAYTLLLVFSSLSDYAHSLFIEKNRGHACARYALISSIVINLAMLGFFKYADFLVGAANSLLHTDIPLPGIHLPIGISFFTFQTMSYTMDVYWGNVHAERSFTGFATFVCLFPQLIAGPIVRYSDIAEELHERSVSLSDAACGVRRFVFGLGKKILIANTMGELCSVFRGSGEQSILFFWIYALAFTLQIYFDFSGYSDMAIGLGRMFGFHFPENFDYPYVSRSVTEFWRRWHMTLGGWFRDYVYIPLGGNRTSRGRWLRNIAAVWLLTGLWHGAAWNFLAWGGLYGVLLILEKLWLGKYLKRGKVLPHVYVMLVVILGFVLFNADGLTGAVYDMRGLFGLLEGIPVVSDETFYYLRSYAVPLLLACAGSLPVWHKTYDRFSEHPAMTLLEPVSVCVLLIAVTACLVDGSFNPFLYFRF